MNYSTGPPLQLTPKHLRFFRERFELSQDDAAHLIGVTRVTWNRWEQGATGIPPMATHAIKWLVQELRTEQEKQELEI